jgi:MFS family permease
VAVKSLTRTFSRWAEAWTDPKLTPEQRRNVLYVALDGVAIGLMSAAASFVSVFVIRLGATPFWVSLLSSIPSTIGLVMTLPWSQFADRQRRPERVFAFSRLAVHVVYPLVALVSFWSESQWAAQVIIVVWSLSAFPSSLSNMMFTLVMGNAVPPQSRAFLMGRRWMVMGAAKLIALPLITRVIDGVAFPHGYQIAFGINALIAILALYCANQLRVPEREPTPSSKRQPLQARVREEVHEVTEARPFLIFISGRVLLNLGLALVSAVIPIYWVQHLDASDAWVGYFTMTLSAATLISYLPWMRLKRKYGTRWTLIPSVLGTALYPALLALARTPAAVLPVIAFDGLVGAGLNLAFFDALLEACPADKQARFVAINMTAVNLMGVIGPPVGAALLGVMGIRWVLVIGTAVALVGVGVFTFAGIGRGRAGRLRAIRGQLRSVAHPRPRQASGRNTNDTLH